MIGVYLIHFDRPYEHARHYIGWSKDIEARMAKHRAGTGARLMAVINEAGIPWRLARVWPGGDRHLERRLTAKAATRACPICTPAAGAGRWPEDRERQDGHRPKPDARGRCQDARHGRPCRRRCYQARRPRPHWRHLPRRPDPLTRLELAGG